MKKFPRFLRLLPFWLLLLLLAAMNYNAAAQNSMPPKINLFNATKTSIMKGEEVILRWEVSHAEHLWISHGNLLNTLECLKETFGRITVKPQQTTTYRLHAWTGSGHVSMDVTIQVRAAPAGFCTISGQINNDRPEYRTEVRLFAEGSQSPLRTMRVDGAGRYSFTNVPAGSYRIVPRGSYPADGRSSIGPMPRQQNVVCQPGLTIRRNFAIGNNEG